MNDHKKQNILSPNGGPTPEKSHLANSKRTANNSKNFGTSISILQGNIGGNTASRLHSNQKQYCRPKARPGINKPLEHVTIIQCNIGGAPKARLAVGSTFRNYLDLYKPTLIAITETKKVRKDIPELPGYKYFTQDPLPGSSGGIAVYFKETLSFRISKVFSSVDNSILWINLKHHKSQKDDLFICVVYAVQSYAPKNKKQVFWKELNDTTSSFQQRPGKRIIVGDFNTRLGSITGDHASNLNKNYFMSFLQNHFLINLNVCKTFGKYTFHNISTGHRSIVDYLLTDMEASEIPKHEVLEGSLGASAQTAHKAILSEIDVTAKETLDIGNKGRPRWRAITEKNKERFLLCLKDELSRPGLHPNYGSVLAAVNRAKTNSIGRKRTRPKSAKNPSPEIDNLDASLSAALKICQAQPTEVNLQKSIALEKQIRAARISHKTRTLLEFLDKLEALHQCDKMRKLYREVKKKTTNPSDPSYVIWNPKSPTSDPSFSSTKQEYLNNWAYYLETTFCMPSFPDFSISGSIPSCPNQDKPISSKEVSSAIKTLKNLKAAGVDEITNEEIKYIEGLRPALVLNILQGIWMDEICPDKFRESLIYLFPKPSKPGKRKDLRYQMNHRPISLLVTFRKLYEAIISGRVMNCVSLHNSQFGFLEGRSTLDCIFLLREAILEARYIIRGKMGGCQQRLYSAFLDLKGAFDKVPRAILWKKLYVRFGIRGKLLRVIMDLFTGVSGVAVVNGMETRQFPIDSGILQGSVLGPTLFLLFIDDLLDELHESELGIPIADFILSVLAYADDITLLALKVNKLQGLLDICHKWTVKNGMTFGLSKCFGVVFNSRSKKSRDLPTLCLGNSIINSFYPEEVPEVYLGATITDRVARTKLTKEKSHPHTTVKDYRSKPNQRYLSRIKGKFNRARHATNQLCPEREILTPTISIRLYKSLQRSTLLYAIELMDWDLDQVRDLETLQAKAIRFHLDLDLQCPKATVRLISGVEPFEARIDLHVLLYYAKLCRADRQNFLGRIHRYRSLNFMALPVGFYFTVKYTLEKYSLGYLWNNLSEEMNSKLKGFLKKNIWLYHWNRDMSASLLCKSIYASVFLQNESSPTYPYKLQTFLNSICSENFERHALSTILRFWLTPNRLRTCPCSVDTQNLVDHLLFECLKTRELIARYTKTLDPQIAKLFTSYNLTNFLGKVACSNNMLMDFNRTVGEFEYPRF